MAICPHCGHEVPDDAIVCPYCGAQLNPDYVVCGNCGRLIPADAKVCPYCGAELTDMARCPNCGREIPADAKSCPYCGYRFDKDEEPVKIDYVTPITTPEHPTGNLSPGKTIKEKNVVKPPIVTYKPPPAKNRFISGFLLGFVIAMVLTAGFMYAFYFQPQIQNLEDKYHKLSLKYDSLVLNYSKLNDTYLKEVQKYDKLLANYTNVTDYSDEKFIVLLFFTTDYGNNKYWLYLEIDPQIYLHYKQMKHLSGSFEYMNEYRNYVVTDSVTQTIVNAVRSKLVTGSDEEFADALLSLVQNKILDGNNGDVYNNLGDSSSGTYYHIDTPAKYPVETMILHSGECLDDSIFYLSLMKTVGFKAGFAFFDLGSVGHVEAWINLTSGHPTHTHNGSYYYADSNRVRYYPAETTGYGWRVGELPDELKGLDFVFVRTS